MTNVQPPVSDAMREAARRQPNSWFYVVDPFFDPSGRVPMYGIAGWYWVDAQGELAEFTRNPEHRPSPVALRLPLPETRSEWLLQCVATGYAPERELGEALAAETTLFTVAHNGGMAALTDDSGRSYAAAFTSAAKIPAGFEPMEITGQTLTRLSARTEIRLDPGAPVSTAIPIGALTEFAGPINAHAKVVVKGTEYRLDHHGEGFDHEDHPEGRECYYHRSVGMGWGGDTGESFGMPIRGTGIQEIHQRYGPGGLSAPAERVPGTASIFGETTCIAICVTIVLRRARKLGEHRVLSDTAVPFDRLPAASAEHLAVAYVAGTAVAVEEDAEDFPATALGVAGQFGIARADQISCAAQAMLLHKIISGRTLTEALSEVVTDVEALGEPDAAELLGCLRDVALPIPPGRETTRVDSSWVESMVRTRPSLAGLVTTAVAVVRATTTFEEAVRVAVNTSADSALLGCLVGQVAGAIGEPRRVPSDWPALSRTRFSVLPAVEYGMVDDVFDDASFNSMPVPPRLSGATGGAGG